MSVSLISHSQAANPSMGSTLLDTVAFVARVSNPTNQNNKTPSEGLINYLIKHKHWSPFEMVNVCLEINTTRDIARQILRHRSFSFQEFSQRYSSVDFAEEAVTREPRLQDTKNRQNSIELDNSNTALPVQWELFQSKVIDAAAEAYEWALEAGIAKEQARAVLPEGLTPSKLYMNGTLRSWIHYIDLRTGNGTQKEHMLIARQCAEAIEPVFPMIMEFVHNAEKEPRKTQ